MPPELNFRLRGDYLAVEPCEADDIPRPSYILARDVTVKAKVLALGPGCLNAALSGNIFGVTEGDLILYTGFAGGEVPQEEGAPRVVILREADILAIIEADEGAGG